jgi:hypothetical protein
LSREIVPSSKLRTMSRISFSFLYFIKVKLIVYGKVRTACVSGRLNWQGKTTRLRRRSDKPHFCLFLLLKIKKEKVYKKELPLKI